jgi:hypothetical protein
MGGKDAMSANRSIMNPVDMAAMAQTGDIKQGMTIKDYIEKVIKVPIDAPVQALAEAIKRQGQNQSGIGKVGAMSQPGMGQPPSMGQPKPPMPNRMPQGRPAAVPPPRPQQGIGDLMGR